MKCEFGRALRVAVPEAIKHGKKRKARLSVPRPRAAVPHGLIDPTSLLGGRALALPFSPRLAPEPVCMPRHLGLSSPKLEGAFCSLGESPSPQRCSLLLRTAPHALMPSSPQALKPPDCHLSVLEPSCCGPALYLRRAREAREQLVITLRVISPRRPARSC